MAKKFQLNVPDPCQEDWKEMKPTGCGRFCGSCQKTVVDFTMMDDQQLALFFKKNTDNVCGRLRQDQLSKDLSAPAKKIPWFGYVLKAIIPAILFSNKGYTQGEVRKIFPDTTQTPPALSKKTIIGDTIMQRIIRGRVFDAKGDPVAFASVLLHGSNIGTLTGKDGLFQLRTNIQDRYVQLDITCVGFDSAQFSYPVNEVEMDAMITLENQGSVFMGLIAVAVPSVKKADPLKYVVYDTLAFKVFPNPVVSGTSLNIELGNAIKEDYYEFRMISFNGNTIFENKIWIDKDARAMNIRVPAIATGNYFAVLRNKKMKKEYAHQLLVIK